MVPSSLKRGRLCFPVYYGLRRPPINFSPLWFDENKERNVYFLQLQQRNSCHSTSDFLTRSLAQMAFAVKQIALQTPMYFEAGRSTRLFDNRRICVLETSFRTSMSLLFAEMLMLVSISVGFLFLFETEAQLHTHGYHIMVLTVREELGVFWGLDFGCSSRAHVIRACSPGCCYWGVVEVKSSGRDIVTET